MLSIGIAFARRTEKLVLFNYIASSIGVSVGWNYPAAFAKVEAIVEGCDRAFITRIELP
jgi:hypothetical protein